MKIETSTPFLQDDAAGSVDGRPVHCILIEPTKGAFNLNLEALWEHRELLYFLAWRDVKARYAQTIIGIGWAVLQPVLIMLIFTMIFSKLANVPSDNLPYPIFAYSALVPWAYFSKSFERSGLSVVAESELIKKVYFPRVIIPFAATLGGLPDFAIAFMLLLAMMAWYGILPTWGILAVPLFVLMTMAASLAVSLWLSALFVKYRDIGSVIPLLTQLWMFASPVAYPASLVPDKWRLLYDLNPMVGVIEGFRWVLLGKASPDFGAMAISITIILVLLVYAIAHFNRMERTFADVI